ncbi:MAG: hypothetical protein ABRQ28_02140 [Smithellaceae bacterium]
MKDKFSGKILDGGLCICDVCGQKSKLGGFINPMSPKPQVVCYDCMIKASALIRPRIWSKSSRKY